MAKALIGGHANRALDFYNTPGKYFIIGGTKFLTTSEKDYNPDAPTGDEYKLVDVVGLKRVDSAFLVIRTTEVENNIFYRGQYWKKVSPPFSTIIEKDAAINDVRILVKEAEGLVKGSKIRISDYQEVYITEKEYTEEGTFITISDFLTKNSPSGTIITGGSIVERAKHVYLECSLEFDEFPLKDNEGTPVTYRQIGVCTGVTPDENILRAARYSPSQSDEFRSLGTLEILDNRAPSTRNKDQREKLSLIVEF